MNAIRHPRALLAALPAAADIRDIRPPFHISQDWLWLAIVGASCVLAATGVAAWRWRHRARLARRLTAHELALAQLREAQTLMAPAQAREFSIAVSGIIRTYIEQGFDIRAANRTTGEFLHDCSAADGALAPYRQLLEVFLRHCDLAKFAGWVLSVAEMRDMLASAVEFVNRTAQSAPATGNAHSQQRATRTPVLTTEATRS